MEGKDELSSLASAINRMLEALERFQEERAVVEEELKNHRDHLEDIVEERTLELQTANKKLVDEMNERKKADENLRNSEEKYRSLVESTDDFIYMVDRDCNYLFINSKYLKKLGITDYMGRNYRDFIRLMKRIDLHKACLTSSIQGYRNNMNMNMREYGAAKH